ncbi:MAG TPA: SLC13 family permease [Hyphomicrobiales bacterium]|nr:SLC13 family permease [Hyphomicrobiales bacterium]
MTQDQIILFSIFVAVFALLIWGRWRYDLVAFVALLVAVLAGVVPTGQAFSGFSLPAVIIIALVLVLSHGLYASGAIDLLMRLIADRARSLAGHIAVMAGIGAGLSAVMNNVAALALLMPADIQAATKAKRSPALSLMPLSFATILGGLITLIGTPPNIIIAAYRERALGESFAMFDFAPVGLACAAVGVAFVALVGWRLIPAARGEHDTTQELFELEGYVAELTVAKGSSAIGKLVAELDETAEEADTVILGLVRRGKRLPGQARRAEIRAGDILVVEAGPDGIDELVGKLKLEYAGEKKHREAAGGGMALVEAVVPRDARAEGRSAQSMRLLSRHGITLLGVSRQGKRFRERVRDLELEAGDVLLLLGPDERLQEIAGWLGALPLAGRKLQVTRRDKAWLAAGIFAVAIGLASFGLVDLVIALAATVVLYVVLGVVPLRDLYEAIEWPVIVLLASLIPIGIALETSGGTELIAQAIVDWTAGSSPVVVLGVLMIVTMTLSDVLNNTATAVVAAPIAVDISGVLGVSPDPFLMAVAVAASCAFLTPIGHKNNILILGPGGYQFGDYWRMGLPVEIIVIAVGVPMILLVWPL